CARSVRRWQARTGQDVAYVPFQTPLPIELLGISRTRAHAAVQLVEPDGRVTSGARAVSRVLRRAPGRRLAGALLAVPPVSLVAELVYGIVARHRPVFGRIDRWLFGRSVAPSSSALAAWLFLSGLGLVHLFAFRSLRVQVLGLYGSNGVLPIRDYLEYLRLIDGRTPEERREWYRRVPTVFWIDASDRTLVAACRTGEALALVLMLGVAPRLALVGLFGLYLSFVTAGRDFMAFQWDSLLLETTLAALLVAPSALVPSAPREHPPTAAVLLLRWIAFRLHYQSGIAKLRSGDPTWRDRTACGYHFETQPLPTRTGWYVHQLPRAVTRWSTRAVLVLECAVPFLAFAPRRLRRLGFLLLSGLQGAIALTGNYGFFNLLSFVLTLSLLDDEPLRRLLPFSPPPLRARPGPIRRFVTGLASAALFGASLVVHFAAYGKRRPSPRALRLIEPLQAVHAVNRYGLFGVMTRRRPEVVIEGSMDGITYREYEFRYKPGDLRRPPLRVAPHQPRLDWQMWFAALDRPPSWFKSLLTRLLQGAPEVLALFARDPFDGRPPRYVRAVLYEYEMTNPETRKRTGVWWRRERIGVYFPVVTLGPDEAVARASLGSRNAR
ncbi:MAG TPA: lipase maturation factor family protein, partial [Polyangiaceae bacterium]|nr:lipase maturation factor family protein [Polyangiaceae bacterium]